MIRVIFNFLKYMKQHLFVFLPVSALKGDIFTDLLNLSITHQASSIKNNHIYSGTMTGPE